MSFISTSVPEGRQASPPPQRRRPNTRHPRHLQRQSTGRAIRRNARHRRRRFLSHHAVNRRRGNLPAVVCARGIERLRPAEDRHRMRRRTCRAGRRHGLSVAGRRTVNFTSGQGIVYAMEQYYHAPGKFSTMVLEVGARALTKHALNVHCGHDDFYAALDTGWTMLMAQGCAAGRRSGDHSAQGQRAVAESRA